MIKSDSNYILIPVKFTIEIYLFKKSQPRSERLGIADGGGSSAAVPDAAAAGASAGGAERRIRLTHRKFSSTDC